MTGSGNKTLWTEDTIAGAILGCVGCFFVQAQLQTLAARVNSAVLSAVAHWWPALLIVAGVGGLFCAEARGGPPEGKAAPPLGGGEMRTQNIRKRTKNRKHNSEAGAVPG